jgi:23S rRNA (cytosine1962-C5)-methyltransferase
MATLWTLKTGLEKKFSSGHPWVFSNDLAHSPKGIKLGDEVELRDGNGNFLARGYGNPNTLIAFRVLTRDSTVAIDEKFFGDSLIQAAKLRKSVGVHRWSHRLCFADSDRLPGLVIDRYRLNNPNKKAAQVFVLQCSTAGMDQNLTKILKGIEILVREEANDELSVDWDQTAIIVANDSKSRQMEGIPSEPKRVEKSIENVDFARAETLVQPPLHGMPDTIFTLDFIGGQKTGFFLDQRSNVANVAQVFQANLQTNPRKVLRVLDLCCYIGQWGAQFAHVAKHLGIEAEITLVDASQKALDLAKENAERYGARVQALKLDIAQDLKAFANNSFDLVVCDPPAFIKKKKDIITGTQAYVKVNREAMKKVVMNGLYFSSSCSGLLDELEFRNVLAKAGTGQRHRDLRWVYKGSHSPDHPQLPEFPQGTYLKSWLGMFLN